MGGVSASAAAHARQLITKAPSPNRRVRQQCCRFSSPSHARRMMSWPSCIASVSVLKFRYKNLSFYPTPTGLPHRRSNKKLDK
jgi:hypothetical protein